jgi:tRNA (cmo5U34)-methyltransferase
MNNAAKRFKQIKAHFEYEAKRFDKMFFKVAPYYKEAITVLISALPFKSGDKPRVIDLGCGTGNITKALMRRYPGASVVCIDLAEKMLELARTKLKRHKNIEYWSGDMRRYRYRGKYDAIISSLVLHHVDKREKGQFYKKIFNSLKKGGVFYAADFVLPPNSYLSRLYTEQWKKFMSKNLNSSQIRDILTRHKDEDKPADIVFELDSLRAAGFSDVEVVWKRYNFAVYGASK